MTVCTFFSHSDCYDLDANVLEKAIETLISQGVDTFYVGHQGHFDSLVLRCLKKLKERYPHISFEVVLAYRPTQNAERTPYPGYSIYPEGMENCPPRFAIERRNKWMIEKADCCLCYINHTWGGAYTFAKRAKNKGLTVIHLGNVEW